MTTGNIVDPYGNHRFLVEIDGITRASFQECTGFDSSVEIKEYREGGDNVTRKLPAQTKYSNIQLKWGMTDDRELYDWHQGIADGNIERKNGSIVLLDRKGDEVARWDFDRAWPTKWDGPDLNGESNDLAIEMIELAHEGIRRA